jgi:hypothetical protein
MLIILLFMAENQQMICAALFARFCSERRDNHPKKGSGIKNRSRLTFFRDIVRHLTMAEIEFVGKED